MFQIWRDSLHRLRSYCWETARRSIRPNLSVHPVGKTMCWINNDWHLFWWSRRAISSLGKIILRAPAEGVKMWCFLVMLWWVRSTAFEGCIVWTSIALSFIGRFRRSFQLVFQKGLLFQMHYIVLIFVARWRYIAQTAIVKVHIGSPKTARNEQVCAHQKSYRK